MSEIINKILPEDLFAGLLIGRAWLPVEITGSIAGPAPVWIKEDGVYDLSSIQPTMAEFIAGDPVHELGRVKKLTKIGEVEEVLENTMSNDQDISKSYFLAPIDLQAVKACGVTFVCSMIERVIEEHAGGDPTKAEGVRQKIGDVIGSDIANIVPGSEEAEALKEFLIKEGLWSQYLEVGIGPYAEVFTKSQVMSSVGLGDYVGLNPISTWNNPEPEVVLIVDANGEVKGATLGNDVNLRDVEGRSALLLGKAKDNNASCSIGPFIRLFDDNFTIDQVRNQKVDVRVEGTDGYVLQDQSRMTEISRDVLDLVEQTINASHQYPDGFALFTGTLFAPIADRESDGKGFTHKIGDVVRISSPDLGTLENTVTWSPDAPPWTFGISALYKNLSARGLLGRN